jgi:two-component system chemotaxis response regulator CheB
LLGDMSPVVRGRVAKVLKGAANLLVVGQVGPKEDIVQQIAKLRPNLVLIGLGGDVRDPFETTKHVMAEAPTPLVIVEDGHDGEDVQKSVLALRLGALAVVPLSDGAGLTGGEAERQRFLSTLKALSEVKLVRRWREWPPVDEPSAVGPRRAIRAVAIAASTGGPAALQRILTDLPPDFPAPILAVQHIAHGFVDGLAHWLNTVSFLTVKIAVEGEALRPRTTYLAPDGYHLGASARGTIVLSDAPPVNGFRPAADYLFESTARTFGAGLTAVVLTGMGHDGVAGLRMVRQRGGDVIAQDEATSVVYGMPKAAVDADLADEVLPLPDIAARLAERAERSSGRRR